MPPVVYAVSVGFKIWMAIDAGKRGMANTWLWIILVIPFGEWVYFFSVKLDDRRMGLGRLFKRRVSLKELEYNARNTPSIQNRLDLAQALYDSGAFERAKNVFSDVMSARPDEKAALYGLALCSARLDQGDGGVAALESLLAIDFDYADFDAVFLFAEALWKKDKREQALELLARVQNKSTRLSHHVRIAEFRVQTDGRDAEITRLSRVLEDFHHSPWYVRKGQHGWAKRARAIIRVAQKAKAKK